MTYAQNPNPNNDHTVPSARTTGSRTTASRTTASQINWGVRPLNSDQFGPDDVIGDKYKVLAVIGRGGCGCVYHVWHMHIRQQFALKTLNPMNMTEVLARRLHKEAQTAARLEHPNLVRAIDFGLIHDVQPFLVMELVEGPTLHQYLATHGKMSVETALETFIPLARAIAFAHSMGVVHRDLKPSNIMLARGDGPNSFTPKIVDFGIAKLQFSDESHGMTLTGTGDVFGTPLYMSPEQCAGLPIDERTDIYSLGCILFEVLTGATPFSGRNALEIMMQHGNASVPSLKEASLGGQYPPAVERVIGRMLAKEVENRYSSCNAVAEDLEKLQRGEHDAIAKTTISALSIPTKSNRISVAAIAVASAIGLVLGLTMGCGLALFKSQEKAPKLDVVDTTAAGNMLALGVDSSLAYFSVTDKNSHERVFHFSQSKNGELGVCSSKEVNRDRRRGQFEGS